MAVGARDGRIDHLRGLAIILVLLHHFSIAYGLRDTAIARAVGWPALHAVLRNGNYGVTMFFVISGFLITANAKRRWDGLAAIHPLAFWRRRAARILPSVLLLLLVVNGGAGLGIAIFRNHPEFGPPVSLAVTDLASLTFTSNLLLARSGWLNYVLSVQWSLAVEEVFYLVFPLLCLLLRRERHVLVALAVLIVLGPVWRAANGDSEYGALYATPACVDAIAFGCGAALLRGRIRAPARVLRPVRAVVGLSMAVLYLSASIMDRIVFGPSLMALGMAILLVADAAEARPASSGPGARALALAGRLSLELYLFHLVVLGLIRTALPPASTGSDLRVALLPLFLAGSFLLAIVLSRAFSEPLNRRLREACGPGAQRLVGSG